MWIEQDSGIRNINKIDKGIKHHLLIGLSYEVKIKTKSGQMLSLELLQLQGQSLGDVQMSPCVTRAATYLDNL